MDVELLYFAGCPNWRVPRDRLARALRAAGHADQWIALVAVDTDERARELRLPGSPAIRVDGRDPFPAPEGAYGMTCRIYPAPDGPGGAPSVDQLVRALSEPSRTAGEALGAPPAAPSAHGAAARRVSLRAAAVWGVEGPGRALCRARSGRGPR
ncbi:MULTISPECIES: hypothetical protein [unclassified Nocardiopsis]|uniref:hypothetical protein n=1 Tax=unclassified Nocardiopsis TaxID=2649073 RepID=UPI001915DDFD|nr:MULTISPECIES: hypothetical protein [unclassified Nocardiopsis]